jgi:hypothetical protein
MADTPDQPEAPHLRVDVVMADLQQRVRAKLRDRLRRRGGDEFDDREVFDAVETLFRRVLELPDEALLLPQMLSDPDAFTLETAIRFKSHRPRIGQALVAIKRRLLLPLTRWLYDFSRLNFERQLRLNQTLLAAVQVLAADQGRLRREIAELKRELSERQTPGTGA